MTATARSNESSIVRVADGVFAERIERVSPLPRRLDPLLAAMTLTRPLPVSILRTRAACTAAEHALQPWRAGLYRGLELRLALCAFCGVVEVRDVSLDVLPGLAVGQGGPRRRDDLLGWYSGARPAGRTYL
jgi:hypothetical protein